MTTFVGAAAGITTATPPTHQVGDFFVVKAFRDGSTTPPTPPAGEGWVPLTNNGAWPAANTSSAVAFCKVADSTSESVGTFANATLVELSVYRPGSGKKLGLGAWAWTTGAAASVTYAALTLVGAASTSWVAALAGHRSINTTLGTPPTSWSNRSNYLDGANEGAIHDSNGPLASWAGQAVAVGGTAAGWITLVVEIREYTDVLTRYISARDDPTNNALVIGIGHSHMAAAGAVTNNSFNGDAIKFGYLQYAADSFTACHAASSDSSVMGEQNVTANGFSPANYNANITLNGWSAYSPISGLGAKHLYSAGASYLGIALDVAFDRFQVFFDGYAASPDPTVNVDGGSSLGTIDMSIPDAFAASSVYSVTDTTHQIRIVAPSANVIVGGVIVWRSTVKQLTFLNCSWAGALVSDFNSAATVWSPATAIQLFGNVAGTIIHLDKNEELTGVALETFRYNLAVLVLARLYYGDVILISSVYTVTTSLSEATQKTYHDAVAAWATLMGCAYVDGTAQPGFDHYATANGLGYMNTDGIHLFAAGYQIAYGEPLLALLDAGATPQNLTAPLLTNTSTFYGPTITTGAVTLSPGLLSNTSIFYAPTVSPGSVTLSPGLFTNAQTFYSPTVSQGGSTQNLTASLLSNSQAFYGPTVTPGPVSLSPGLLANTSTFYAASVTPGTVSLSSGLLTNASTLYGPVVTPGAVTLSPGRLDNVNGFYSPTVAPGAVTLSPPLLANVSVFYPPSVLVPGGLQNLSAGLLTNLSVFFPAAVNQNDPPGTYPLAIEGGGTVVIQMIGGTPTVVGGSITFTGSVVAEALKGRP